jgi:hypothetical protein
MLNIRIPLGITFHNVTTLGFNLNIDVNIRIPLGIAFANFLNVTTLGSMYVQNPILR